MTELRGATKSLIFEDLAAAVEWCTSHAPPTSGQEDLIWSWHERQAGPRPECLRLLLFGGP